MDVEAAFLFCTALALATANLPLLVLRPSLREQRLWRRMGIQRVRRWISRRRHPGYKHRDGRTPEVARTNILWHLALSVILSWLIFHPMIRTGPLRLCRYLLVLACVAYFIGSLVQRQKIVIATMQRLD